MLGTGLGHTQYWLQAGVTQYTDCTDAAGWAGQSTVVGGHTGHTTPAPGTQGGPGHYTDHYTLGHLGGGWPGHGTWVSVSLDCVSCTPHYWPVSSVSLHVSVSQGAWPSPHYPPHSAHSGCWHWAPAPVWARPHWLTAPLQLSSLYRVGPGPTNTGKQPAQAFEPRWEALTVSKYVTRPRIGGWRRISAWDWPVVFLLPTLETDIADTYQDIDSSPSSRPLSQYEGFLIIWKKKCTMSLYF